jgi:hypothetical protein
MSSPQSEIVSSEDHFAAAQLAKSLHVVTRGEGFGFFAQGVELLPLDRARGAADFAESAWVEEELDALANVQLAGLLLADVACAGRVWGCG